MSFFFSITQKICVFLLSDKEFVLQIRKRAKDLQQAHAFPWDTDAKVIILSKVNNLDSSRASTHISASCLMVTKRST